MVYLLKMVDLSMAMLNYQMVSSICEVDTMIPINFLDILGWLGSSPPVEMCGESDRWSYSDGP